MQTTTPASSTATHPAQQGTTPVTGTIAHGFIPFYIVEFANLTEAAQALYGLFERRKPSPEREAIWEGYYAVKRQANEYVENLRDRGGLLFVGCPAALAAARALEAARHSVKRAGAAA